VESAFFFEVKNGSSYEKVMGKTALSYMNFRLVYVITVKSEALIRNVC